MTRPPRDRFRLRVRRWLNLFATVIVFLTLASRANAAPFSITIFVDETGVGVFTNTSGVLTTLPADLQNDPGPGGLHNVLTYSLLNPPGLVAGDVLFVEPGGILGDVVRFNPGEACDGSIGCLVFYSNPVDGFDSSADTLTPPGAFYPNFVVLQEVTQGTNNLVSYTPGPGQPGFVAGAGGPVTFDMISDTLVNTAVPEPTTALLFGSALLGLVGPLARRKRGKASGEARRAA